MTLSERIKALAAKARQNKSADGDVRVEHFVELCDMLAEIAKPLEAFLPKKK